MTGSSGEFIGSELRLVMPGELVTTLRVANLIEEAAAVETVRAASLRDKHPNDNLIPVIKNLRGDLYLSQRHLEKPHLRQLGEAGEAMALLEEGYIALRAAHARRLRDYAAQANEFLDTYHGCLGFQNEEGHWTPVTRVGVSEPDRWHHDPELYAQADDQQLALLEGQLQCNRVALGPEIEARLAALD